MGSGPARASEQTEAEAWRHVAKGAIEYLQGHDLTLAETISSGCEAIAAAIMALGVQEELFTVASTTDLPTRDGAHRVLDDPRYADRCGRSWIIAGDPQLHECYQPKAHTASGYASGTDSNVHQCVCGLTRSDS